MPLILHIHTQHCACGVSQRWTRLYSAEALPANRYGSGQKLLPIASLGPEDPVHALELPHQKIPICDECIGDRKGLGESTYAAWAETLRRKRLEDTAASAPRAAKRETSLDDLI